MSKTHNGGKVATDLTLRDHFASVALQGELASQHPEWESCNYNNSDEEARGLAEWCYRMADAMLIARRVDPSLLNRDDA